MLRLGVIGHGGRISGVIRCLREVEPDIRVVGIIDPDEPGARGRLDECDRADVVFYPDLATMVKGARLHGLAIGTRCNLHAPYAVEAARYDLPLYLEKPIAVSFDQARAVERAFRDTRCQVVVSFPLRVSPLCMLARQRIRDGGIGVPQHILAVNYVPYGTVYFDHAYRNYEITQGLFLQKATHDFDYMSDLLDSPIVRVAAMKSCGRVFGGDKPAGLMCSACDEQETCLESPAARTRNRAGGVLEDHACVFGADIGTPETGMNEDSSSALVAFASGVQGAYTQVFMTRRDAGARGATISGYAGTLSFDWYRNDLRHVHHHRPFTETVQPDGGMSHFGGDLELAYDFVDLLNGKGASRTPITAGLRSVYACLAARQSAQTGQFVDVIQPGEA